MREVIDDGVTGVVFASEEEMADGLDRVFALDRARVRERGVERYGAMRMVDEYIEIYQRLVDEDRSVPATTAATEERR